MGGFGSQACLEDLAMRDLSLHHAHGIHQWDDRGQWCFHPLTKCPYGECKGDDLQCPGKPYHTRNALTRGLLSAFPASITMNRISSCPIDRMVTS